MNYLPESELPMTFYCHGGMGWLWSGFPLPSSGFWLRVSPHDPFFIHHPPKLAANLLKEGHQGRPLRTTEWSWPLFTGWGLHYLYCGASKSHYRSEKVAKGAYQEKTRPALGSDLVRFFLGTRPGLMWQCPGTKSHMYCIVTHIIYIPKINLVGESKGQHLL